MQNNGRQGRFLLHSVVSFSFISLNLISSALVCLIFVIKSIPKVQEKAK